MGCHRRHKFRAVSTIDTARERFKLQKYLDSTEKADEEPQSTIDSSAGRRHSKSWRQHPEPEAGFMLITRNTLPAYNMQAAVDAEHSLIVANTVLLNSSDNQCLQPMAKAAKDVLEIDNFCVVADAGYSTGFRRRRALLRSLRRGCRHRIPLSLSRIIAWSANQGLNDLTRGLPCGLT